MEICDNSFPSISKDIVCEQVDDSLVVYQVVTQTFYKLNGTGLEIWGYIDGKKNIVDIAKSIFDVYEEKSDIILEDLRSFIKDLYKKKILDVR